MSDHNIVSIMKTRRLINKFFGGDAAHRGFMEGWHEGIHFARTGHTEHHADQCPQLLEWDDEDVEEDE